MSKSVQEEYKALANPNCEYCQGLGIISMYDSKTFLACKCTSKYEEQETDEGSRGIV